MNLFQSMAGYLQIEATSANVSEMLSAISGSGIILHDVIMKNELVICATVSKNDYLYLSKLLNKRGEDLKIIHKSGVFWTILTIHKRPVLLFGLLILLLLTIFLPTRVLFVKVNGNSRVSAQSILDAAQRAGISFGTSRSRVRSEVVKNALLSEIPELQWVGVNTHGCVAEISVEERTEEVKVQKNRSVSSIVAKHDAIIRQITVTRGNQLCKVGQAVAAGQVLVSGYTDCGIIIKATGAAAEIYGETSHVLQAVTPTKYIYRRGNGKEIKRYGLIIGKNIINFFKDSGISDTECVKMYEKKYLTLPGGLQLPLGITCEHRLSCDKVLVCDNDFSTFNWLERYTDLYLLSQMVAGRIIDKQISFDQKNDTVQFACDYSCYEMIGQIYNEEIYTINEQSS